MDKFIDEFDWPSTRTPNEKCRVSLRPHPDGAKVHIEAYADGAMKYPGVTFRTVDLPKIIGALQRAQEEAGRMTNHDMIALAVGVYKDQQLTTAQIRELVQAAYPSFSDGSLLPNDHATGNECPCSCAGTDSRIFDRVEKGLYLVR